MKILFFINAFFSSLFVFGGEILRSKEIRVSTAFRYPVDPLNIVSMADYDLALLLSRNWFDFDDGRTAKPGLIESWQFDSKEGGYFFEISKNSKWSNGRHIVSRDLILNIERILHSDTSYGKALNSILDDKRIREISQKKFFIGFLNSKPNESFFQRMGSIFMASVELESLQLSENFKGIQISAGPYQVQTVSFNELVLIKNQHWTGHDLSQAPEKIVFRKPVTEFRLSDFLSKQTWENLTQISSMIPLEAEKHLAELKLPTWSRDHDRVSLMRALPGKNLERRIALVKKIWSVKNKILSTKKLPAGVRLANSLQPFGYPLFEDLAVEGGEVNLHRIEIAATDSMASRAQEKYLSPVFDSIGVKAHWNFVSKDKFIPLLKGESSYDFVFFDFGVADPEPLTWVSLIYNMEFVSLDHKDREAFSSATQSPDRLVEIKNLKTFLKRVAKKGGYVPFFHFSTISLGQNGINFKNIRDLDETVDLSKVIMD